jgi:uncharacterized protein (TIGR02453 family)
MLQLSTLSFLKKLKKNNNKIWFEKHREEYLSSKNDFENFVAQLIKQISVFDNDIKELQPKNCTFRINRDIRFSKDKTPYKTNMGASFNRGGKKSIFAGYYFHLEPAGQSFAGGGLWMPTPPDLRKLRQEIDYCLPEFSKILSASSFKAQYNGLTMEKDQMLVNVPKGYDKENPASAYLKLKSFTALKNISDEQLTSPDLVKATTKIFKALTPLVKFINRAFE